MSKIKLDFNYECKNSVVSFNVMDNGTSRIVVDIESFGEKVELDNSIAVMAILKPSGKVHSQFGDIKGNQVILNLEESSLNEVGIYTARLLLINGDKRKMTRSFKYEVEQENILSQILNDVVGSSDYPLLTDMLSRLSTIENDEEQRKLNEAQRILNEDARVEAESLRVEAELTREHNDADREKAEAVRGTNENNRVKAEKLRSTNEDARVGAESSRVEAENLRVEAENLRNDNYNFMTEDENRRRSNEDARVEAEAERVKVEANRVSEESKRRTVETARVKAEDSRVKAETSRAGAETNRVEAETSRAEAERTRSSRYESLIGEAEKSVQNFNSYASSAKLEEAERSDNEISRVEAEELRSSNELTRSNNEKVRVKNEQLRVEREATRGNIFDAKVAEVSNKINEVNTAKNTMVADTKKAIDKMTSDFNSLSASQQQDAEVILARDGEESLNARLERDLAKGKIVNETLEGPYIICTDTVDGIVTDIEILGNTVQNPENLSDIKSVGVDNGDGTYSVDVVSCGKNLVSALEVGGIVNDTGKEFVADDRIRTPFIKVRRASTIICRKSLGTYIGIYMYDANKKYIDFINRDNVHYTFDTEVAYVRFVVTGTADIENCKLQVEYGSSSTEYEDYKEFKSTIKLPCQLEKVGDIADRLYFDKVENAWCIEKKIQKKCFIVENVYIGQNVVLARMNKGNLIQSLPNTVVSNKYIEYISEEFDSIENVNKFSVMLNAKYIDVILDKANGTVKEQLEKQVEGMDILFNSLSPQKIVLPLDVQIQLNQFLGTTNAWLECGEVDGTIKATFSKSITATTQANTKAIDLLETRVQNIEGLKESQDMEYETDKGYLVCKETRNGTIKDLKISGKSLKNVCAKRDFTIEGDGAGLTHDLGTLTEPIPNDVEYTVIAKVPSNLPNKNCFFRGCDKNGSGKANIFDGDELYNNRGGILVKKITNAPTYDTPLVNVRLFTNATTGTFKLNDVMVIIGDHTQIPPNAYFEGIASVGNGADKIEVSSVKASGNLFDGELELGSINGSTGENAPQTNCIRSKNFINVCDASEIVFSSDLGYSPSVSEYDSNFKFIRSVDASPSITLSKGTKYIKFRTSVGKVENDLNCKFMINKGIQPISYKPYKEDKKPILFKDVDGTWKPVAELRGLGTVCDTIELHNDGKYYYHQRTNKTTLNELSAINLCTNMQVEGYLTVQMTIGDYSKSMGVGTIVSEKYKVGIDKADMSEGIYCKDNYLGYSTIAIRVLNSKANTVEAFKQYLQTNNDTLIYQLAEEKVFEVNPLFLEAFEGETMMSISSGVINAPLEFKIASYITNLVFLNQQRISILEDQVMGMFKSVLSGDMRTLAETLYPQDFVLNDDEIMLINK